MFGCAPEPVAASRSRRRNFQGKRQRRLLLRDGRALWGVGASTVGIHNSAEWTTSFSFAGAPPLPPVLGFYYVPPAAHVEIDYDTFSVDLAEKDIIVPPPRTGGWLRH